MERTRSQTVRMLQEHNESRRRVSGGDDPYRIFAMTIINNSVDLIEAYMRRQPPPGKACYKLVTEESRRRFKHLYRQSVINAYLWLFSGTVSARGLSFEGLCDCLGVDSSWMRAGIRNRLNRSPGRFNAIAREVQSYLDTLQIEAAEIVRREKLAAGS